MNVEINSNIEMYKETVAFGLTAKQMLFSIASVAVGGSIVLLFYPIIGLTGAAYIAMPCVIPVALGGFGTFAGMDFYEYISRFIYFMLFNRPVCYESMEEEVLKQYLIRKEWDEKKERTKKKIGKERRFDE